MGSQKQGRLSAGASLSLATANKQKRQDLFISHKKTASKAKRDLRFRRRKEESKDPELRARRIAENQPASIDRKRVWDDVDDDSLGAVVDVAQLQRRRIEQAEAAALAQEEGRDVDVNGGKAATDHDEDEDDDLGSMIDSEEEQEEELEERRARRSRRDPSLVPSNAPSIAPSTTSTNFDLTPSSLAAKFPMLFSEEPPAMPKILVTTCLRSTLHHEAEMLCGLLPNANYIPRSSHRYGHKYSVREIAGFASNRDYTSLVVLNEHLKKPSGISIVCLPAGPTFHFTISKFVPGKRIPGHGNPTNHWPELLLNNFKTPLGILTAALFWNLFPPQPEVEGRQVVTIHNSRDYLLLRRHRYIYREKRQTEKSVLNVEGKEIAGFEQIKVGLQELGPAINMKLRRVDKGIGRAGSEGEDAVQWQWKADMDVKRTRFNL